MIWELVYKIGVDVLSIWKPYTFPSPVDVIKSLYFLSIDNTLLIAVGASMERLMIGYLLSVIIGIPLGILIVRYKYVGENIKSIILGLQTLPSICWLPFAILWYGLSEKTIIFVIAMGSIFAISIATEGAINNVYPLYIKAAKTMGAKGFKLYLNVVMPASLPSIIAGLKQGWSFAWRALMAGEMLVATKGLGQVLMIGRDLADISQVLAVMIVIIAIGLLLDNVVFGRIEASIRQKWGLEVKL
ncbi:binding-protein-dependent transport systems inner membrane component [Clostridium carboxidivorans P7]|uniref:Binding-protein-dependent transport systems inner membrane component n=1 Tax=Clostridium carboxidivorans P7 TaxID=536227 RepID=C6PP02_9CLOT|nr:ABC transporter permease [Clostridium carboxidivorans]EET89080.1 binding-protein-dependent transport systems inner membrane component [Clostridium carboxidivorans P7]